MCAARTKRTAGWLLALIVALSHATPLAADDPSAKKGLLSRLLGREGKASKVQSSGPGKGRVSRVESPEPEIVITAAAQEHAAERSRQIILPMNWPS
jgi:hypothetical protein